MTYFVRHLIKHIESPPEISSNSRGIWLLAVFFSFAIIAQLSKNHNQFQMYRLVIRLRKTLYCLVYDKVSKLSLQSISQTNSGKVISLIASDFDSI
jgi:ABC-type transport system involved in cytochrome bd biosynthesis fused ATPase/permease subunit